MARSLALEPLVNEGLLQGHVETSGQYFKDQETGLWIKVRPDVASRPALDFVDLKTASEVITQALQYTIRRLWATTSRARWSG